MDVLKSIELTINDNHKSYSLNLFQVDDDKIDFQGNEEISSSFYNDIISLSTLQRLNKAFNNYDDTRQLLEHLEALNKIGKLKIKDSKTEDGLACLVLSFEYEIQTLKTVKLLEIKVLKVEQLFSEKKILEELESVKRDMKLLENEQKVQKDKYEKLLKEQQEQKKDSDEKYNLLNKMFTELSSKKEEEKPSQSITK